MSKSVTSRGLVVVVMCDLHFFLGTFREFVANAFCLGYKLLVEDVTLADNRIFEPLHVGSVLAVDALHHALCFFCHIF